MSEMQDRIDAAVGDWANSVPVDQIPAILAFLSARFLSEGCADRSGDRSGASGRETETLLKAGELAERLNLPESWIRNEERLGRIPSLRAGKYVRFKLKDVERSLTERNQQRV